MSRRWLLVALLVTTFELSATPKLWDTECALCHVDDTPTCAGCHSHHLDLIAEPDAAVYLPGAPFEIAFSGAELPGWIRAVLYDHHDDEIDRVTGPTETGDDGHGPAIADSIITPAVLRGVVPDVAGTYTWHAAYFGVLDFREAEHGETWVPLTITVADTTSERASWSSLKRRYAFRR